MVRILNKTLMFIFPLALICVWLWMAGGLGVSLSFAEEGKGEDMQRSKTVMGQDFLLAPPPVKPKVPLYVLPKKRDLSAADVPAQPGTIGQKPPVPSPADLAAFPTQNDKPLEQLPPEAIAQEYFNISDKPEGDEFTVEFRAAEEDLPDEAVGLLRGIAGVMHADRTTRLELRSYATASGMREARRLSLSRARAVRTYLIEQGIRSTRIDLRALGDQAEAGPADRIDLKLF